jgi:hypothetical protein
VILIFVKFLSKPLFLDLYSLIFFCKVVFLRVQLFLKGQPIVSQIDSSQAFYSVFKDVSHLASNSLRYPKFFIDSVLLFIAESRCYPYSLLRRVCDSPHRFNGESLFVRIICINSHLSFNTRSRYPRIVYYGESLLPASLIAGSHCCQW